MSINNKSKQIAEEYGVKAKQFMDKVTAEQPEEVKERVDKVQKTVSKTVNKAKEAVN